MPETHVRGQFKLIDHHEQVVSEKSYAGSWVLVFFGFTHCRMVCPRALRKLSDVLDELGAVADRIQPLYITVDPERDTPPVMRAFLATDYPRFIGLTGSPEQIDEAKASFRVFARRTPDAEDPDGYIMPHSAMTYLLDPEGRYMEHFADVTDGGEMVDRLRQRIA